MNNVEKCFRYLKFFILIYTILISLKMKKQKKKENSIFPNNDEDKEEEKENKNDDINNIYDFNNTNIEISETEDPNPIEIKKKQDLKDLERYNKLSDVPKNRSDPLIMKERNTLLSNYYRDINKRDMIIFFDMGFPFGNQIAAFNKMIFYCEILGCKKIIIFEDNKMFINHTLYDKDYNMKIEIGNYDNISPNVDLITAISPNFFYDFYNLKIENRLDIIKNEIVNNLPKV